MTDTSDHFRAVVAEYLGAHRALEMASADAESEPTPIGRGPKLEALAESSRRYAMAYQGLERLCLAPHALDGLPVVLPPSEHDRSYLRTAIQVALSEEPMLRRRSSDHNSRALQARDAAA